jgi:hypothetical protein
MSFSSLVWTCVKVCLLTYIKWIWILFSELSWVWIFLLCLTNGFTNYGFRFWQMYFLGTFCFFVLFFLQWRYFWADYLEPQGKHWRYLFICLLMLRYSNFKSVWSFRNKISVGSLKHQSVGKLSQLSRFEWWIKQDSWSGERSVSWICMIS